LRTEELIDRLVADAGPVKPLLSPARRALLWGVAAGICVALGVLHFGLRDDAAEVWHSVGVVLRIVLLAAITWLAVVTAFRLSVPGHDSRAWSRWYPLALLGVLVAIVTGEVVIGALADGMGSPLLSWSCVRKVAFVGALPAALAIVLIQRASAIEPRWAALLGVLAAGAAGALTSELACPMHAPIHILLWHVLPVAASAVLGAVLGVLFWNRSGSGRTRP
jgi:hypothetical protein